MATTPIPSTVRVARIYAGRDILRMRGVVPANPLVLPAQHPLSMDWSWLDATQLCADWGENLLDPPGKSVTFGDGALNILQSGISPDGKQAGVYLSGGTNGVSYTITFRLTGVVTGRQQSFDVGIYISGDVPVVFTPNIATMNRDLFTVGGLVISPGGS